MTEFFIVTAVKTSNITLRMMFENSILRGIRDSKTEDVTRKWRKSHNGSSYFVTIRNIVRVLKSRLMRGGGA
jgi:hypothetical protein